MIDTKKLVLLFAIGAAFSIQPFAGEQQQANTNEQTQSSALELETAELDALQLSTVEAEADLNSNEIHQEATVGRAGLAGACCGRDSGNMC